MNHHQQIDVAWRFTLREFFMVSDFKNEGKRRGVATSSGYDRERLGGLQEHLKSMGVI